jgi:Protein of unknown function (DUF3047)
MRLPAFAGFLLAATAGQAQSLNLFDDFARDWRSRWQEQTLLAGATVYEVAPAAGRPALRASSKSSASSLYRRLDLPMPSAARLRWSWLVQEAVPLTVSERTKSGDDYAVRVTVVFEHSALPLRSRALQYVWATREPVGTVFPSPYSGNVGMIVLRTGGAEAGVWREENRDILADYVRFFGRPATRLSAVAIMTDSDNSRTKAEGWYAGLKLELGSTPLAAIP